MNKNYNLQKYVKSLEFANILSAALQVRRLQPEKKITGSCMLPVIL